jgi:hypothetical protein
MLHKTFWLLVTIMLTCFGASASDIRRVVTGLDANNKSVTLFDSRVPLASGAYSLASVNLWITDSYPPALIFNGDDPATKPIRHFAAGQRHEASHRRIPAVGCSY